MLATLQRTRSAAEDFALDPVGRLTLGDRVVEVPPLTRARFLRLTSFDPRTLLEFVRACAVVAVSEEEDLSGDAAPYVEKLLAELGDVLAVVVPDLDREAWRRHGRAEHVLAVANMLLRAHDYGYIVDRIFPPPTDDEIEEAEAEQRAPRRTPVSRETEEIALLLYCAEFGERREDLEATRIEGFLRKMEIANEIFRQRQGRAVRERTTDEDGNVVERVVGGLDELGGLAAAFGGAVGRAPDAPARMTELDASEADLRRRAAAAGVDPDAPGGEGDS